RPGVARRDRRGRHVGARRRVRHRADPARRDRHARAGAARAVRRLRARLPQAPRRPRRALPGRSAVPVHHGAPRQRGQHRVRRGQAARPRRLRHRPRARHARARRRGPPRRLRRAHRWRWRRLRAKRPRVALEPARAGEPPACRRALLTQEQGQAARLPEGPGAPRAARHGGRPRRLPRGAAEPPGRHPVGRAAQAQHRGGAVTEPACGAVPILLYHSIADEPSEFIAPYTVSPATFHRHLDAVAATGATTLTVSDFMAARAEGTLPARPVLVTFDDGYRDTLTVAAPALAERGMVATTYVTTGVVDGVSPGGDPMMTWAQVDELAAMGHEIGAHSHTHPQLDTLPLRAVCRE